MLGNAVQSILQVANIDVMSSARKSSPMPGLIQFDATSQSPNHLFESTGNLDYVINCIGVIKPHINDNNRKQVKNAIQINSIFPNELAEQAEIHGFKVIQIATDCVFSGSTGDYSESSPHEPHDVYGKTKSLGEVTSPNFMNIRCSIIGPENGRSTSLWEWVANQPSGAEVNGYLDHLWNGVTTKAFGEICRGVIEKDQFLAGTHHLVPFDSANKHELVSMIAETVGRTDIRVTPINTGVPINRTISTEFPEVNKALWAGAGYSSVPSIREMVEAAAAGSNL